MKYSRGFTLIELLVVIAIIGLLSAVILAALTTARGQANDARRVSDMKEVQKALEVYASDHGGLYPATTASRWDSICAIGGTGQNLPQDQVVPGLVPTYISAFPKDPETNTTAAKCCYLYKSNGNDYKILTGYNCPTSPTTVGGSGGRSSYSQLLDPERPTYPPAAFATYSGNIQSPAQCQGGNTSAACW